MIAQLVTFGFFISSYCHVNWSYSVSLQYNICPKRKFVYTFLTVRKNICTRKECLKPRVLPLLKKKISSLVVCSLLFRVILKRFNPFVRWCCGVTDNITWNAVWTILEIFSANFRKPEYDEEKKGYQLCGRVGRRIRSERFVRASDWTAKVEIKNAYYNGRTPHCM